VVNRWPNSESGDCGNFIKLSTLNYIPAATRSKCDSSSTASCRTHKGAPPASWRFRPQLPNAQSSSERDGAFTG